MNKTHNCSILCPTLTWFFSFLTFIFLFITDTDSDKDKERRRRRRIWPYIWSNTLWILLCLWFSFVSTRWRQRKATCLCVYLVSWQKPRMWKSRGRLHRSFPPATFTLLLFSFFTPLFAGSLLSWKTHATAISVSLVCEWVSWALWPSGVGIYSLLTYTMCFTLFCFPYWARYFPYKVMYSIILMSCFLSGQDDLFSKICFCVHLNTDTVE